MGLRPPLYVGGYDFSDKLLDAGSPPCNLTRSWQTLVQQTTFVMRNLRQRTEKPPGKYTALGAAIVMVCLLLSAQAQFGGRRLGRGSYQTRNPERIREQELMQKALEPGFEEDVF